jgi:hypothetical protein
MSDYAGVSEAMNLITGNRINTRIIEALALVHQRVESSLSI